MPDTKNAIQDARDLRRELKRSTDAYISLGKKPLTYEEIGKRIVSAYKGGMGR